MLKAIEILKNMKQGSFTPYLEKSLIQIDEAIEELEQYEQKFKDKEFKYRTDCQNILSAGRVEADNMPDRLAELEKVILDYYLAKGYGLGVGGWTFNVVIDSDYKEKELEVWFYDGDELPYSKVFTALETNTKEMYDKAIEYFRSGK